MPDKKAALVARNQDAVTQAFPLLDQISKNWVKIEDYFRKKGILREVQIEYGPLVEEYDDDIHAVGDCYVGIQKIKGQWRICHGLQYHSRAHLGIEWEPVTDTPSTVRVELLDTVNDLFEAMVESNEEYVKEIAEAAEKSEAILSDLELADL